MYVGTRYLPTSNYHAQLHIIILCIITQLLCTQNPQICEGKLIAYIFARLYKSFDLEVALACGLFLEINITATITTESQTEM